MKPLSVNAQAVSKTPRLFFALWPDAATRQALVAVQRRIATHFPHARWVPPERLHLTLHFLGRLRPEVADSARALAREVVAEAFELELGHLGCFERARVLWLGPVGVPEALAALQASLGQRLSAIGYHSPFDRFRPHVTLARKVRALPDTLKEPPPRLRWPVSGFALVASVDTRDGVVYEVLERYPFR